MSESDPPSGPPPQAGLIPIKVVEGDIHVAHPDGTSTPLFTPEQREKIRSNLSKTSTKLEGDGMDIDIGGACPVQGYGHVNGLPVYFRARGENWSFSIAALADADPVDVSWGNADGWWFEGEYGSGFDAGWMVAEHSTAIIRACVKAWTASGGSRAAFGKLDVTGCPSEVE